MFWETGELERDFVWLGFFKPSADLSPMTYEW